MRILHVIRTLDPATGGPVEGVRNLARAASARGHRAEIVCLDDAKAPWLSRPGTAVHPVGSACSLYGFSKELDRWLSGHLPSFDVVVVHGVWMYIGYAVRKAARRAAIPYYLFTHGAIDPWFRRYRFKHLKKTVYWAALEHKVFRDAEAVMFTTAEEMELAKDAFFPYKCTPKIAGYGIARPPRCDTSDREAIHREFAASQPRLSNRRYLLFLSRIHEKKGLDLALRALSAAKARLPGMAFVVAGPGDESLVRNLKELARSLGIEEDVVWTGPLYGDAKWNAMRAADAYILPSHQENFGIGVVESLACGVPVIISDRVNIWREVLAESAGLVGPDTVPGTIEALKRWSSLSEREESDLRNNARRCFDLHFDLEVTCNRYLSILQESSRMAVSQ